MNLYLDLIKRALIGLVYEDPALHTGVFTTYARTIGSDWPAHAHTMIGWKGLSNIQSRVESILADKIPGDLIECGVWRGGACVLMQAMLKVYGETTRQLWVADSFKGVPPPEHPEDKNFNLASVPCLAVPQSEVRHNFELYNLLDDNVHFLEGWFADTLPTTPIGKLAFLRLDGDLYKSTMDTLENLYPKLSIGGYVDIDDYNLSCCRAAVESYRMQHGIKEPYCYGPDVPGVYWRKEV